MVSPRITPSKSITTKQIRVPLVHPEETRRQPWWWMTKDNNPLHQQ
jgi:hypothetical protein